MKHILCDVDGVLINGYHVNPEKRVSWHRNLKEDFGIAPDDMEKVFFFGPFPQVMEGKLGLVEALESVSEQLGYSGNVQEIIDYWFKKDSIINTHFLDWVKSNSGKGCKFILATNQEHMRAKYLWNELNFKEHFQGMYYAAQVGAKKPHAAFFEHIIDDLKTHPSDICLIDDCPKNVATAKSLGMHGIVFNDMNDVNNHPFLDEMKI